MNSYKFSTLRDLCITILVNTKLLTKFSFKNVDPFDSTEHYPNDCRNVETAIIICFSN